MNVRLQNDNSLHKYAMQSKLDDRMHFTSCGKVFAGMGQPCPDKETHRIIFPGCILHTRPVKCRDCFA